MKEFKRISVVLAVALILSSVLSLTAFSHTQNCSEIDKNNKIFACIPNNYLYTDYYEGLCYMDEYSNTITFAVYENKFAPEGISSLNKEKIKVVFDYAYFSDGDVEYLNSFDVTYKSIEKRTVNGMSAYELKGCYGEDYSVYFCGYLFATKEDVFAVVYEDFENQLKDLSDLNVVLSTIVLNGTFIGSDKPAKAYDFSGLPPFWEAVENAEDNYYDDEASDYGMDEDIAIIAGIIIALIGIVPTLIVVIIGGIYIYKYKENKKRLNKYISVYGPLDPRNFPQPQQPVPQGVPYGQGYQPQQSSPQGVPYGQSYQPQQPAPQGMPYGQGYQPQPTAPQGVPYGQNPRPEGQGVLFGQSVDGGYGQSVENNTVQSNLPPELQDSVKEENQ